MRYLFLLLFLCNCQNGDGIKSIGLAGTLFQHQELVSHNGLFAVENSYVYKGNDLISLFDLNASGQMTYAVVGENYKNISNVTPVLSDGARFSYVIENQGRYENLVTRNAKIYLLTSDDLINWTDEGVILDNSNNREEINHQQWNASHCYDSSNNRHMLVESGSGVVPSQQDVELIHYINETPSAISSIKGGGNAWITFIDGKGFLSIHGVVSNGYWIVQASILREGETNWITIPAEVFSFTAPALDVADPHLIETLDGYILMSMSYAQNSAATFITTEKMNFSELFDYLEGAL